MFRVLFCSLALLLFGFQGFAQSEQIRSLRDKLAERNYASASDDLKSMRASDAAAFDTNNLDYLLARSLEMTGNAAEASAVYQSVVKRRSVLKEYALWHLAALSRTTGDLITERIYLEEIVSFSPDSLLLSAAKQRLVRSWFESGNFDQVIKLLTLPPAATNTAPQATRAQRENLVFLADAYYRAGNIPKAKETYLRLINEIANPAQPDDSALAGVRGLDVIGHQNKEPAAQPLTDYELLKRASIYQFNRDFTRARAYYAAILSNYPTGGVAPDAMFQTGRGYALEGNFTDALVWYERVLVQFPEHPVAKDALLQAASLYSRLGKRPEAITRYQQYISKYPDDERVDRAYLNIIDVYRDGREDADALKWAADARAKFAGKVPEALALFSQVRIRLTAGDWQNALNDLEALSRLSDLGGATTPGSTNKSEITFLRGLVLEQLGRFPEAVDTYISIPDGRNEYYGWRANERLASFAKDDRSKQAVAVKLASFLNAMQTGDLESRRRNIQAAIRLTSDVEPRKTLLDELKKVYSQLPAYKNNFSFRFLDLGRKQPRTTAEKPAASEPHQQIADELLYLGLYDEAAPELEAARKPVTIAQKTDFDYTLAVLYKRADRGDKASAFVEPLWRAPADYQIELIPPAVTELLYPAPYAGPLVKFAPPRGVDPRFVLAIMRQESRFRADVKSYAAARGLMQFISSTSDKIAAELRRKDFRQDDLYDPPTAVLFGSQYLSDLFKLFPDQTQAVAASYNGGDDNMKRWLARARAPEADLYVPEIAFAQSKDYVYKVMSNYRMYRLLYDENLKPQQR